MWGARGVCVLAWASMGCILDCGLIVWAAQVFTYLAKAQQAVRALLLHVSSSRSVFLPICLILRHVNYSMLSRWWPTGVCFEACIVSCCVIKHVTRGMLCWGSGTAQGAAGISGYWLTQCLHVCARMPAVFLSRSVLCASEHCMYLRHPFLLLHVACMRTTLLGLGWGRSHGDSG